MLQTIASDMYQNMNHCMCSWSSQLVYSVPSLVCMHAEGAHGMLHGDVYLTCRSANAQHKALQHAHCKTLNWQSSALVEISLIRSMNDHSGMGSPGCPSTVQSHIRNSCR
jgi:hypothetical protein